jgi:hypothetical protein
MLGIMLLSYLFIVQFLYLFLVIFVTACLIGCFHSLQLEDKPKSQDRFLGRSQILLKDTSFATTEVFLFHKYFFDVILTSLSACILDNYMTFIDVASFSIRLMKSTRLPAFA